MKPIEAIIRSAEQNPSSPAQAACQGVAGAFSHRACLEVFDQPDIQFYPQFEDVFRAEALESAATALFLSKIPWLALSPITMT